MPISEFQVRRRVQFYETDVAGIVHFSWFFRYMEEAEHAMWREAGLSIHPPGGEIGWPRIAPPPGGRLVWPPCGAWFNVRGPLRSEAASAAPSRTGKSTSRTWGYVCPLPGGARDVPAGPMTIPCGGKRSTQPMEAIEIPAEI